MSCPSPGDWGGEVGLVSPGLSGARPLQKPLLFSPFKMRSVTAPNRCVVSPMVQYRATDGQVNDYHLVHLGKFALGKFGIVFTENCAIEPRGRVTQGDLGMWDDSQIEGHRRLARFLKQNGNRHVVIEGHTDERGGREYNLALGQRRAEAVRRALELLGVRDTQLEAVSFGKEKPAVPGNDESAWSQNRRAEIAYR